MLPFFVRLCKIFKLPSPPIPIKAKYLVLVYGFYEIWSEFNRMPGDNVAHLAHLGGMLIAYIILRYWKNKYGTYY